jgi:hypothetical protein
LEADMAERIGGSYRPLLEVRLLHHYWLDDWLDEEALVFDDIADPAKREARLRSYDIRPLLSVRPSPATQDILTGLGCLFRATSLGFIVAAPGGAVFPANTVLSFVVSVADGQVFNYTALTLRPQRIFELVDPADTTPERMTYRYKENVPVLSNAAGTTRGENLFLSREIPGSSANDPVEALVTIGSALAQLTSDNPGATTQQLGPAAKLPAYVSQADVPAIVPPAGISGAPARGVVLSPDIPDDVFALIRLAAVCDGNDRFSFADATGTPKNPPPVYQVRLKNRSTTWVYRKKETGTVLSTEANPLPLTHFGNAGFGRKPSPGVITMEQTGGKITRLISEIYV